MKNFYTFLVFAGISLPLSASVPVPEGIRNPFEIPDPTGFKSSLGTSAGAKSERSAVEAAKAAAFDKVKEKLYSLPLRGIVSEMHKGASGGDTTVLLGPYTLRTGSTLPASDFEIKGLIRVTSVSPEKIVVKVSIELETKEITIPLAR